MSVKREVKASINKLQAAIMDASKNNKKKKKKEKLPEQELQIHLVQLEADMQDAARALDFEKAIQLRAQWKELKQRVG